MTDELKTVQIVDVTEENSKSIITPGNANLIQPLSTNSGNAEITKNESLTKSDDLNVFKTSSNTSEAFTKIPSFSFLNNNLFTNMLRSKETEETPVVHYESTRVDKMRLRKLHRTMNKKNEVILAEQINGYCGDRSINDIVDYIEGNKSATEGKKRSKKPNKRNEKSDENKKNTEKNSSKNGVKNGKLNENKTVNNKESNVSKAIPKKKRKVKQEKVTDENDTSSVEIKSSKMACSKSDNSRELKPLMDKKNNAKPKLKTDDDKINKIEHNNSLVSRKDEKLKTTVSLNKNKIATVGNGEQLKENNITNQRINAASKPKKGKIGKQSHMIKEAQ